MMAIPFHKTCPCLPWVEMAGSHLCLWSREEGEEKEEKPWEGGRPPGGKLGS